MRGKIFIIAIVCLLLLSFWPYLPALYQQKPSEHDPFDKVPEDDVVPGIDSDGDLLKDLDEKEVGTDPLMPDTDGDNFKDGDEYHYWMNRYKEEQDIFPAGILDWLKDRHPDKTEEEILELFRPTGDLDRDGLSNILDVDSDGDGLGDGKELSINTDPANPDTDGDGVPDKLDPNPIDNIYDPDLLPPDYQDYYNISNPHGDADFDNKTNLQEYLDGTSPIFPGDELDHFDDDIMDMNDFFDTNFSRIIFEVEPLHSPRYWRLTGYDYYFHNNWYQEDLSNNTYTGELTTGVTVFKSVDVC